MENNNICWNIACIMGDVLSDHEDLTSGLFGWLFGNESSLQILLFSLNDSQEDQIQLLMDFYENEKIPDHKPDGLAVEIWSLLNLESGKNTHSFLVARTAVILAVLLNCESAYLLSQNEPRKSVLAYGQSSAMFGTSMALAGSYWSKDSVSANARRAAEERHATDPRQKDKAAVRQCWDEWRMKPDRYKGKAEFARDMLTKYENLKSQPVIEGWCRMWENLTPPAQ